jgi:ABC-type glycerol-3-phosphate transport system substrate-binding protein
MAHHRFITRVVAAAAVAALFSVPAALPAAQATRAKAPVEITFWSWVPKIQTAIDLFNKTHSLVSVVPLIIAFIFLQRFWNNSLTLGTSAG